MFLMMDSNRVNEPSDHGVTSLEGLYTDFDGWVARYNSYHTRSTYFSKEISTKNLQIDSRQNRESDILEKDVFFGDSLLRHRHLRRSAKKTPYFNFHKENDGFVSFDQVFYRFVNKNGDRRIILQYIRSKL